MTTYVFGNYEVDTQRHELRHAGTPCALEPQTFNLLVYLVQRRDRVVSKAELLEHLWPHTTVRERRLSRRLARLRQAVGDRGRQQIIQTVYGRGYQFVAAVEEQTES